ncbi:hypothetical protein TNCV_878251 [Trichonephila clavipes]|nr:hypothetical protein TNCV_878251 [Trichonephila clavipes]
MVMNDTWAGNPVQTSTPRQWKDFGRRHISLHQTLYKFSRLFFRDHLRSIFGLAPNWGSNREASDSIGLNTELHTQSEDTHQCCRQMERLIDVSRLFLDFFS